MARSKQATPIRRETSSEYFSKNDRAAPRSKGASSPGGKSEEANGYPVAPKKAAKVDGDVIQLVIAVAGIYGSL